MKSVKLKVSLIANLITVVCLIILGVVTFMFVKQAIFHEVVKAETNYVKTAKNSMESFKARNSLALESLAKSILKHPVEQLDNQDALMHYVGKDLKNFRDAGRFLAVYIAQPNGELVVSDPDSDAKNLDFGTYGKADNYDARTREYYIEAVKTNKLYITPSYIDVTTNLPCFTYSIPLYKDGKFIGVLAVDILAADLQAEFENLPGRTFVFDEENKVFVSTDKALLQKGYDISAIANLAKTKEDLEPFEYTRPKDGNERFAVCTKVSGIYTACVGEPIEQIEAPVYKIAFIQTAIVIFTSIISVILLYFIVSKYLSPLAAIQTGLTSFFDFINYKTKNVSTIEVNYEEPKICILKIFFPTLDSSNEFKIPKDFKIQKELHHDLNSKHIVLYGFEYQNFDIEKCFKIIEKNQNFSLDFPNYINAYDGFRIFLFYLFKKLKFYWTLSLERKDKQSLCEFLFYSRSLYIVLSSMNTILDKNLSNILALKFKDITKKTQDILASENSNQDLLLFLSDEKIQDLFNDFDFFIKENSFYEGDCKDRFFKQLVALELRKKIILFRKNILKNFDLELFENSFFELAIFLEYFYRFLEIKNLNKLYEKYCKDRDKNIFSKIINNKNKFCKLLKKSSKNLKIYKG